MRTLICGSLLLLPFTTGSAQDTDQNQPKRVEITYSLSGQEMYRTWCATCHGLEGKGNGPAASALKKAPADLTMLSKKHGGKFPAERVRSYIEGKDAGNIDSHGSREMPIWGPVFRSIDATPASVTYRLFTLSSYLEGLQTK